MLERIQEDTDTVQVKIRQSQTNGLTLPKITYMVELFEDGVVGFDGFVGRFEGRKKYKKNSCTLRLCG